jgi:signal transduction histidine kinase
MASPALLWRVLSNVVDNAARAVGRDGRVTVSIDQPDDTVIEVADDGPGFGSGPPGKASLGLDIITSLLESCGGKLEVRSPSAGGALVRIVLPSRMAKALAAAGAGQGE